MMIPNPKPAWWPDGAEVEDHTVAVSHLVPPLIRFLQDAALVYAQRFAKPLVITSGNDGKHAPGSKHYAWKAVDLRSRELSMAEQQDFAHWLSDVQGSYPLGVFDERFIGPPHWHVEVA